MTDGPIGDRRPGEVTGPDLTPEQRARAILDRGGDDLADLTPEERLEIFRLASLGSGHDTAAPDDRGSPVQRWEFVLDGSRHVVQLGAWGAHDAPRDFMVDGRDCWSLGGPIHRGPRIATIDIGEHEVSLTRRELMASLRVNWVRSFKASIFNLRGVVDAFSSGIAGVGGGAAAAAATSSLLAWAIYELRVDGTRLGSWVAVVVGGSLSSWTFVEPGGPLPEPDWPDWPSPRAARP